MPKISIKPETVFNIFSFHLTNSLFLSFFVFITFLLVAIKYSKEANSKNKSGFFYFIQFIIKSIYSLFQSVLGENINYFFPLLLAFFLYIVLNNWFGLLPGVGSILIKVKENHEEIFVPLLRGNNADLNSTLILGLVSVTLIQFFGIKFLGFREYIKKFINLSNPINFILGILEIVSEISRVLSFSFRLFGNIFAGEVLLTIVAFLVPFLAAFPFLLLEIFVGFIQSLVFTMLTAVFINGAIQKHN